MSSPATSTNQVLSQEMQQREKEVNRFPLHVFPEPIKPFIDWLVNDLSLERSYVGSLMLSAYSTGIGTSYVVKLKNGKEISLSLWVAMVGLSSAGKSATADFIYGPIKDLQKKFDREYVERKLAILSEDGGEKKLQHTSFAQIMIQDVHVPTLVRTQLNDNPKGLLRLEDELMSWINSMNALSRGKESSDEQFWLSSWQSVPYRMTRAQKESFYVERPFINLAGGLVYKKLARLFANDRSESGFIYRLLFATPEQDHMVDIPIDIERPEELFEIHSRSINNLYESLPVPSSDHVPKQLRFSHGAIQAFNEWNKIKKGRIDRIDDLSQREIEGGIFGKMKEYSWRFSGLLHLAEKSYLENPIYHPIEEISASTMNKALELADYFFYSALEVYDKAAQNVTAPARVLQIAGLLRANRSARQIASIIDGTDTEAAKKKMNREIKGLITQYPRVFNAIPK
ncbi:MAG: hypothetical protein ACI82Q_002404 [Nonlabens sp.]|jgi:hypothetical protein